MNLPFILEHLKEIAEVLCHPCAYSFLRVPVQSRNDSIMTTMNRESTMGEFKTIVVTLYQLVPEMKIATAIICGFIGKMVEDFTQRLDLIRDYKFPQVHISQLYLRPGTPASRMKKVPSNIFKKRTQELTFVFESFTPYEGIEGKASLIAKAEKRSQLERPLLANQEIRGKESERERQARVLETKKQEVQMLAFQIALKALQSSQPPPALRERETVPTTSRVSVHERLGPHEVRSTDISRIHCEDPQAPIVSIHLGQEAQADISRDHRPSKQPEEVLRPPYRASLPEHMSEETGNHVPKLIRQTVLAVPVFAAVPAAPIPLHYISQELID
ncbi:hypothetical protein GIB67_001712 [Kingdonia uniflora]|uniref:Uncharacterized protein n=1 Tax=Kingdonia uniflora TaxID=39325 RepID=A0A7J7LMZ3_9MAGN|nr:hypothetical protein GIB67_001712 [Kingdonia uniflora]